MEATENQIHERLRELKKVKTQLLGKMRRQRKAYAKNAAQKKQVNDEIKRLKADINLFTGMSKDEAIKKVSDEIRAVKPEDIYPPDLEKEFDLLDKKMQGMKVEDEPDKHLKDDDSDQFVGFDSDDGVIDMSEEDGYDAA